MMTVDEHEEEEENGRVSDDDGGHEEDNAASLIIPISSFSNDPNFIEIFHEELKEIPSSTLLQVLKDEHADLSVWADVGLAYMQQHLAGESSAILQAACDRPGGNREQKVRLLASAGIAHLALGEKGEDHRAQADQRFTSASKVDTFFPMTWMGKGCLNFAANRFDQARFFFDTTLKQCGQVLPALLGMASVLYREKDYRGAQEMYAKAIRLYPEVGGASVRVGFGLACYRLGQVDRAKAAFRRALALDPEFVPAMVGSAILDMASLDVSQRDFSTRTEQAIKMISMANLLDHSNAMVQNHLANHYFWKWTPVSGTMSVTEKSKIVRGSQPVPLDPGERIRIGVNFETVVLDEEEDNMSFRIKDEWKGESISGLKLWKKDYDRVSALAKGAYNSTTVKEIQAESLFLLARVHHVREDMENAQKLYEKACKLAPDLSPARFGLAQTLIAQEEYQEAAAHLRLVLGTSSTATDAQALLGLLEAKSNKITEGLSYLKKAIDMDPLNPDLIILEALALQQQKSDYPKSLGRYKKAVELLRKQGNPIPHELYCNIGVLCHETKDFDESLVMYQKALEVLDAPGNEATLDHVGREGGYIRHRNNNMFYSFLDTNLQAVPSSNEPSTTLQLKGDTLTRHPLRVGDHVKLEAFETEITEINEADGVVTITIKDAYSPPKPPESETKPNENAQDKGEEKEGEKADGEKADGEQKEGEQKEGEEKEPHRKESPPPVPVGLMVKRENKRLENSQAITIAFNIARVHENAGRTLAAVELLKAIVKRVPAYVNCYLRLACIARDCGSLKECSSWLKIACQAAPGNPEVLTLVGNLHLSLCDWGPAQNVFDQLLMKRVSSVEAYSKLSIGNIYFANLNVPKTYTKHLKKAADLYKSILQKDKANAYAANGIGTILAEKGELFKAKEVFNRVREVSGDTIADAHLNLGHIYLAQKKHPEALQMYQSYMKRTQDGSAPITTKSREEDEAEVLLYIAFAYFDWARQTEQFNNAQAAPADERYRKCMEHLELAHKKSKRREVLLQYNLCMTKLQAANCVLQKLTRNIRRTAQEVADALEGLEESLPKVQEILGWKTEGKKIYIPTNMLQDFITHCKTNIESARSHLEEEKRREEEANQIRELQRVTAESQRREQEIRVVMQREEETKKQEERDRKAAEKMMKVEQLRQGWEYEASMQKAAAEKKRTRSKPPPPGDEIAEMVEVDEPADNDDEPPPMQDNTPHEQQGDQPATTEKDIFGISDEDESDEELLAGDKRPAQDEEAHPSKKMRTLEDSD